MHGLASNQIQHALSAPVVGRTRWEAARTDRGHTAAEEQSGGVMWRFIALRLFGAMITSSLLAAGCGSGGGGGPSPPVISTEPAPPTGTTGAAYPAFTFTSM